MDLEQIVDTKYKLESTEDELYNLTCIDFEDQLFSFVENGKLYPPAGKDYFTFYTFHYRFLFPDKQVINNRKTPVCYVFDRKILTLTKNYKFHKYIHGKDMRAYDTKKKTYTDKYSVNKKYQYYNEEYDSVFGNIDEYDMDKFYLKIQLPYLSIEYLNEIYLLDYQKSLTFYNDISEEKNILIKNFIEAYEDGRPLKSIYRHLMFINLSEKQREIYAQEFVNWLQKNDKTHVFFERKSTVRLENVIDLDIFNLFKYMIDLYFYVKDLSPVKHFFSNMKEYINNISIKSKLDEYAQENKLNYKVQIRKFFFLDKYNLKLILSQGTFLPLSTDNISDNINHGFFFF